MRRVYLLGAVCLVIGFAAILFAQSPSSVPVRAPQLEGRYQIIFTPGESRTAIAGVFLLDTQTGTIWRQREASDYAGEPIVWMVETRIDSSSALSQWLSTQTKKK